MNWLKALVLLAAVVLSASDGVCGEISVTNISLGTRDAGTGNAPINFDISWNNSWRSTDNGAPAPNNWDAAWVFVKFRKNGGNWAHASLNDTGHTIPSGASLDVGLVDTSASFNIATNPVVGVFIYRSADGVGTFTKTGFSLSWKFTQDGVSEDDAIDIRVYAIEMVYVPTGSFFAGDNATSAASFQQGSSDTDPWYIGSESAITTGTQAGSGTGVGETNSEYRYVSKNYSGESTTGAAFTIAAAFPKGYQKFYMMKGEISQSQWVSFFNTLTSSQRATRNITDGSGKDSDALIKRNNVSWISGDATLPDQGGGATYANVAMNYLSWADLASYLDWAGLRPMSELEFEKAARGPYRAVSGEYAWGSTTITGATSISNAGLPNEAPGAAANCVYYNVGMPGPMRVGAMAAGDSTRVASGAGYYGAMDLSGNVLERPVTVGNATGRGFNGAMHGNGVLTSGGDGNVTTWPGTDAVGVGLRGGSYSNFASDARTSERFAAAFTYSSRAHYYGGRGVRSAP